MYDAVIQQSLGKLYVKQTTELNAKAATKYSNHGISVPIVFKVVRFLPIISLIKAYDSFGDMQPQKLILR